MKLAVVNLKKIYHTICGMGGKITVIHPNSYHIIDSIDSEREYKIWSTMAETTLQKYGLRVILDEQEICSLDSGISDTANKDVSITDGFVSPVAKAIADSILPERKDSGKTDDTGSFKESDLLQMDKEDLFNLCDNFNIKYKRNNSVKTLVNLLIENGVGTHDVG